MALMKKDKVPLEECYKGSFVEGSIWIHNMVPYYRDLTELQ